jgi:two-component system chemotaxis response regulator CheB
MDQRTDHPRIVAIGASAGGVSAISRLLAQLPADLNASVMIALHRPADRASYLQGALERATALQVKLAYQDEVLKSGSCYVAPPDRHLTLGPDGRINLLPDGFYRGHDIG